MTMFKKDLNYYFAVFFLLLISFFLTIDNFSLQSATNSGLILSQKVIYPDQFTNVSVAHFNSWTSLHHLTLILLKMKINIFVLSKILIYISTVFFSFGIFLLVFSITKSNLIALSVVCFTLVGKYNFGDLDYPALIYFEHTYGMFSFSTFTLFVGLLFNKNLRIAGFFLVLLISVHIVIGTWVLFLILFIFFYLKYIKKTDELNNDFIKKFLKGFLFGLVPIFFSFIYHRKNLINKTSYDSNNFNLYMDLWDTHRNITDINYVYIILTFVLLFFFFCSFQKSNRKKPFEDFLFLFILIHCLGSMILYIMYKIIPDYFPEIFVRGMIARVFLIHTHIGYPLIISFCYILFKNNSYFNSRLYGNLGFITLIIIFASALFFNKYTNRDFVSNKDLYSKISYRIEIFKKNMSNNLEPNEEKFWRDVSRYNSSGYFVTTSKTSDPTIRFGRKPYIINTNYFDHIPYHPHTVDHVKIILENIYKIKFDEPPIKHLSKINDEWIIETFKNRTEDEWIDLRNKYNLSGVIVPSSWKLNIKNKILSSKYTLYKLE